jgi:hypothetical protein
MVYLKLKKSNKNIRLFSENIIQKNQIFLTQIPMLSCLGQKNLISKIK